MSDPLLTYAVTTNPDPLQASPQTGDPSLATLIIVVSNDTHQVIDCQSISFGFLKGTEAKDFFSDSTGIGTTAPTGWAIEQDDALFTATPVTKEGGQIGADGVTFVLSNIKVNEQPGMTQMTVTEVAGSQTGTLEVLLAKFPPQFSVGDLTADPHIVEAGGSTTLTWSGTSGASYELQYTDADGNTVTIDHPKDEPDQPLPSTGSYTVDNLQDDPTVFYLIVTLQVPGQDSPLVVNRFFPVTVTIPSVRITSFTASQTTVYGENNQVLVMLSWETTVAEQVLLNNELVEGQGANVIINETTTFTLEATGNKGPVFAELKVTVQDVGLSLTQGNSGPNYAALIATFGANPGNYSAAFSATPEGIGTQTPALLGTVPVTVTGTSQVITVVGPQIAFEASAQVTVTGFPSGPLTATYVP